MRIAIVLAATLAGAGLAAAGAGKDWGVKAGQETVVLLSEAGTLPYHCHPHPAMKGVVHVVADRAPTNETVRIKDYLYDPANLTVGVGSNVTFRNEDTVFHTVTETAHEHQSTPAAGLLVALLGVVVAAFATRR